MNKGWRRATEMYRLDKEMKDDASKISQMDRAQAEKNKQKQIAQTTRALYYFLVSSDGQVGMKLLKISGQHIILGEDYEGGGVGVVFFLDGLGLRKSVEAMGLGAAYSTWTGGKVRKPTFSGISYQEAVEAAMQFGGMKPAVILPYIKKELDRIARKAPKV